MWLIPGVLTPRGEARLIPFPFSVIPVRLGGSLAAGRERCVSVPMEASMRGIPRCGHRVWRHVGYADGAHHDRRADQGNGFDPYSRLPIRV